MARYCDGNDAFSSDGAILTSVPFTFACWANPDNVTGAEVLIGFADLGASSHQYHLLWLRGDVGGDPVYATSRANTTTVNAATTSGYSTGVWQHFAGVWAANDDRRVYLNGGNKGTDTTSCTPSASALRALIAFYSSYVPAQGNWLHGSVAEVGIWNVALTDTEVAMLADGVCPLFVRPASLFAYIPLLARYGQSPTLEMNLVSSTVGDMFFTQTGSPAASAHPRIIYPSRTLSATAAGGASPGGGILMDQYYRRVRGRL